MIRLMRDWLARIWKKSKDDQPIERPYMVVCATSANDALESSGVPKLWGVHTDRFVAAVKATPVQGTSFWTIDCEYLPCIAASELAELHVRRSQTEVCIWLHYVQFCNRFSYMCLAWNEHMPTADLKYDDLTVLEIVTW